MPTTPHTRTHSHTLSSHTPSPHSHAHLPSPAPTATPVPPTCLPTSLLQDFERLLDQSFDSFLTSTVLSPSAHPSPPCTILPLPTSSGHPSPPCTILPLPTPPSPPSHVSPPLFYPLTPLPLPPPPPALAPPSTTSFLSFALLNTRSLVGHATEIADHIVANDLDLMAISETWLRPESSHAALLATPPGYSILRQDRPSTFPGGGVALIFRDTLDIHQVSIPLISGCEILFVKVSINPNTSISLIILYRPPEKMSEFEEQFLALLADLTTPLSKVAIIGDLNYWAFNPTDKAAASLLSAFDGLGFTQHVRLPTQEKGNILDWVISLNLSLHSLSIKDCPWSDHSIVSFSLELPEKPQRLDSIARIMCPARNLRNITPSSFAAAAAPLLAALPDSSCPDVLAEQFLSTTSRVMALLAPERQRKVKPETRHKTWFGDEVLAARNSKRAAERAWRSSKDTETKAAYKAAAAQYKATIISAKKSLYDSRIINAQSSPKELFKIVKELEATTVTAVNIPRDDSWCQSIQDALFNKVEGHRQNIFSKLAAATAAGSSLPLPPLQPPVSSVGPFHFSPISVKDLTDIVLGMKPTSCKGDVCPASIIKDCIATLAPLITKVVNASFATSSIPASLKHAWITPLLKKASLDPAVAGNYRPITNVPFLLKILDRVAYLQVQKFLEDNHLLGLRQSGFRAKHGTETALIDLKANISKIIENGRPALLMLLDLSAAFDLVDHHILTTQLTSSSCFSTAAAAWIDSFLSGRSARVFSGSSSASPAALDCGVPQGSCLSPTLYNLYTRPLFDHLDRLGVSYTNYADDTQFVFELSGDHAQDSRIINDLFAFVQAWMLQNSLALNDSKTELLILGTPQRLKRLDPSYRQFLLAGCPIDVASHVKTLGVHLDAHLNMQTHVKHLKSSCAYICKLLRQIRPYLSEDSTAHLARALVVSRLDYCNGVLAGTSAGNLHDLQVIQNNAIRAVKRAGPREHIAPLRRALHWLPVKQRINHKVVTLVHKCRANAAPPYLAARLTPATATRVTRSGVEHKLFQPRHKLQSVGASMFDVLAPRLWNDLPVSIRSIPSLDSFKRAVKTLYFA